MCGTTTAFSPVPVLRDFPPVPPCFPLSACVVFFKISLCSWQRWLPSLMLPIGLFFSLSLTPPPLLSLLCGDGVCGQKGRGRHSLKRCWLHFSTSDKTIAHRLININSQKTENHGVLSSTSIYERPVATAHWYLGKERQTIGFFPLFVSATALFIVQWKTDLWSSLEIRRPHWRKTTISQETFRPEWKRKYIQNIKKKRKHKQAAK